jgi:hypothetical protein
MTMTRKKLHRKTTKDAIADNLYYESYDYKDYKTKNRYKTDFDYDDYNSKPEKSTEKLHRVVIKIDYDDNKESKDQFILNKTILKFDKGSHGDMKSHCCDSVIKDCYCALMSSTENCYSFRFFIYVLPAVTLLCSFFDTVVLCL